MSQLALSEGQPGNWEEPDFFLCLLETARFQEKGWQERYDGRLSRTVLRGPGGEIPPGYSTQRLADKLTDHNILGSPLFLEINNTNRRCG